MATEHTQSTSTGLINRAKNDESDAWFRLARLYTPLVYRWARQGGLQSVDARDVVQEVFKAILANISSFRPIGDKTSFRGWLWTITRNQVRLYYRKNAVRPQATGGSDAKALFDQYPDLLEREHEPDGFDSRTSVVHRALQIIRGDFSDQTWKVFWRLVVEGHLAADIAEELGMKPTAVRQAKYRVLCRLREELEGC